MKNQSCSDSTHRIVAESYMRDIGDALQAHQDTRFDSIRAEFATMRSRATLCEGLSDSDWNKLGVLAGLLWYKLDTLIQAIKDSNQELKNIAAKR